MAAIALLMRAQRAGIRRVRGSLIAQDVGLSVTKQTGPQFQAVHFYRRSGAASKGRAGLVLLQWHSPFCARAPCMTSRPCACKSKCRVFSKPLKQGADRSSHRWMVEAAKLVRSPKYVIQKPEFPMPQALQLAAVVPLIAAALCAGCIAWDKRKHPQKMWIMNFAWPLCAVCGHVLVLGFYLWVGRQTPDGSIAVRSCAPTRLGPTLNA